MGFASRWRAAMRLGSRLRGWFPLTWLGLAVAAGCAWAFFGYGLARIDLVLLVVGAVGLALTALATLTTLLAALLVRVRAPAGGQREAIDVECGYPVATDFSLPRLWWLPLAAVSWEWSEPAARVRVEPRGGRLAERVVAARRGQVDAIVRRVSVGDVFGLTRLSFFLREQRRVRFIPSVGALERIDVIRGMSAGDDISHPDGPPDGDLHDLRSYTPGDPIRFVLWKVFARSRELVVRAPERALSSTRRTAAYLIAHEADEAAAGAARLAAQRGALGADWVFGADGCDSDARSGHELLDLLARSGRGAALGGPGPASGPGPGRGKGEAPGPAASGLAPFLRRAAPTRHSRAVIFAPARPGPWLEAALQACRGHGGRVEFIVCCDGFARASARRWWRLPGAAPIDAARLATGAASSADELAAVVRALSSGGGSVMVVDRVAGKVFGAGHLSSFLAEAA